MLKTRLFPFAVPRHTICRWKRPRDAEAHNHKCSNSFAHLIVLPHEIAAIQQGRSRPGNFPRRRAWPPRFSATSLRQPSSPEASRRSACPARRRSRLLPQRLHLETHPKRRHGSGRRPQRRRVSFPSAVLRGKPLSGGGNAHHARRAQSAAVFMAGRRSPPPSVRPRLPRPCPDTGRRRGRAGPAASACAAAAAARLAGGFFAPRIGPNAAACSASPQNGPPFAEDPVVRWLPAAQASRP
jgi:hypothetical protein